MVIDLETGVMRDGTIVARRGWLVLDNGAYTADAAFFPQLAAMHVAGPYRIPHLRIDSQLVYTNTQPSGSVRAPTAPQACWALEQHVDEVARRIGMDGLEFRRRNAVDTGDVGPSGQTFEQIGMQRVPRARRRAVGLRDRRAAGRRGDRRRDRLVADASPARPAPTSSSTATGPA